MTDLGPELFEQLNCTGWGLSRAQPEFGRGGLAPRAIEQIESQLEATLPPDFRYLLLNLRDPSHVFFPWSDFSLKLYDETIAGIWDGIAFDIGEGFWMDRWGEKPDKHEEAVAVAREDFNSWPTLLPIYGHRFLPATPCLPRNPVFSIMQTDIIFYGADLGDYLANEFLSPSVNLGDTAPVREIDVWSDFAQGRVVWPT
jgi:hypothetical protein